MVNISIEVDMADVLAKLEAMSARSHDFKPVFRDAKRTLEAANASNFDTGGMLVGGWEPRRDRYAWPILNRTGTLEGSLTSLDGPPNKIDKTSAQFGTDVEYAKFHQTGTTKMASRKIVFEPRGFARGVAENAADHILGMGKYFAR